MNKEINFETFLFVGFKKIIISVNKKDNFKTVHKKEIKFSNELNQFQLNRLNDFLDENIFFIEKKLNYLIQNIYIILEHKEFIPIGISIKKQNYGNIIKKENLIYSLNEIKSYCKKTLEGKKIIHMLIDNYIADNNSYSLLPKNLKSDYFSLDIRFICLPDNIVKNLEDILKKYQIAIQQIVEASYIINSNKQSVEDIFLKTKNILEGSNNNEVKILKKMRKNKGFFEKFFNLFS